MESNKGDVKMRGWKSLFGVVVMTLGLQAQTLELGSYLERFDYKEREEMKIKLAEALALYEAGEAEILDIRFQEEWEVWRLGFGKHIPLPELPGRLGELDKKRLIITICPHYDRALMARLYLVTQGFKARYLSDGMLGMVGYLRRANAKEFLEEIKK